MAPLPPPQGMSETDYETIEAAVTETVRGRWFLGEFARRNRTAELRQLLDAMGRIEAVVSVAQPALPPSDPSIRLLMQRVKEIAAHLERVSDEMREGGVDPYFPEAIDQQARAVAGMLRSPGRETLPPRAGAAHALERREPTALPAQASPVPPVAPPRAKSRGDEGSAPIQEESASARPGFLAEIDALPLAEKLALFS